MEERDESHIPAQQDQATGADTPTGTGDAAAKTEVIWEIRVATFGVLVVFVATVISFVAAIFISIYQGVTTPPKVWRAPLQAGGSGVLLKPRHVRDCVKNLQALDQEQHRHSETLWFQMRHGHRGHLTLWQEWSHSWRRRMEQLRHQCPMATGPNALASVKLMSLPQCVKQYQTLSATLRTKSDALWQKARHSRKSDLRLWKDWSADWRRRMQLLVQRCPIYNKGEIAKAFQRASQSMLKLQTRQEKAMLQFFGDSADLFRDLRQAMHSLKEELR